MSTFLSRWLSKFRKKTQPLSKAEKEGSEIFAFREELEKLISAGRMDIALDILVEKGVKDAAMLKRQYDEGKKHFDKRRITYEEWSRIQARIHYAIMELTQDFS